MRACLTSTDFSKNRFVFCIEAANGMKLGVILRTLVKQTGFNRPEEGDKTNHITQVQQ